MLAVEHPKGEVHMSRHESMIANLIRYFALVMLLLMVGGRAEAQTGLQSADKVKTSTPSTEPANTSPPAGNSAIDLTKGLAASAKIETDLMNARADAKSKPVTTPAPQVPQPCKRTISADVVAFSQPIMLNRLGAAIPDGLIFALKSDTVIDKITKQIQLRPGKRPRPLVLRANVGDCLQIDFIDAISGDTFTKTKVAGASTGTKEVSLHIQGMEWVTGPKDDGSFVGRNDSSLASPVPPPPPPSPMPGNKQTYTLFAREEGTFMMYTMGDTSTQGDQLTRGLFGALNVQPSGVDAKGRPWESEWYRSQVSAEDLLLATYNANRPDQVPPGSLVCTPPGSANCVFTINGKSVKVIKTPDFGIGPGKTIGGYLNTLDNHPLIDYDTVYPAVRLDGTPIPAELVGTPVLKMLDAKNRIVRSDLTAIITGPNAGRFPGGNGDPNKPDPPCNAENNPALNPPPGVKVDPLFCQNPAAPDRKQPYREITVMYHGALGPITQQAFPVFTDPGISNTLTAGQDAFAINYGTGGIGAEVYANRIGVGPMADCVDCKFEEFFLSAWSVGDPAMLVNKPANSNNLAQQSGFQSPCKTTADFTKPPCAGTRSNPGFPYTMTPDVKATEAFFPDDPSNVYHSYINDHLKFRILHGGRDVTHVHHQHAHQWLQSPNSDESSYLDSQMISPGASYTLEMVYNGSGNRNKVVGDSIFHCHFYPHFAAGMWAMWRTHDVFENGTFVYPDNTTVNGSDVSNQVVPGSRALPDGEIIAGSPNPALVPLPTIPMAPLPAYAQIKNKVTVDGSPTPIAFGGQVVLGGTCKANQINGLDVIGGCVDGTLLNGTVINSQYDHARVKMVGQFLPSPKNILENPGYPYFIPGIAGARAPHPPLDFAPDGSGGFLDGGLPRHVVTGGSMSFEAHTQTDWSKDLATMTALQLPEDGTTAEKSAIKYFSNRCYPTFFPDGTAGSCPPPAVTSPQMTMLTPPTGFILNGLPLGPQSGAPFADPAVDDNGKPVNIDPVTKKQRVRVYKAAAIQRDVTFNKVGWHFNQQRMLTLWGDVAPTIAYKFGNPASGRKPEPLFFRGNSGDIIEYWHTNLVPNYYLLDDFQVRTPTDILGQHIHLVKFDVTSSDGAGNGFNYEDGTFSPEEVQDIHKALVAPGGSWIACPGCVSTLRNPQPPPPEICNVPNPPAQCATEWLGAQTTIQRWYLDPQVDDSYPNRSADGSYGVDRTLRTVFTHDHFGPSTHQQAGLYAGLLVEPTDSTWTSNDGVQNFGSRFDGGPTSWQARIITKNNADSYREFMLEFQDLQLAYQVVHGAEQAINKPPDGPSLVSTGLTAAPAGTQSVNYTNDPIALRIGSQDVFPAPSPMSDLSYVYDNATYAALHPGNTPADNDPSTPVMRAYQNDKVQIRLLVGAHVFAHQFDFEGPTWLAEPSWKNSGYRSVQAMGLSEHFEFLFNVPSSSAPKTGRKCPDGMSQGNCTDYLYSPSFDQTGLANGLWGLFRSYDPNKVATGVKPLPNNPVGPATNVTYSTCPAVLQAPAIKRTFNITAVTAQKALSVRSPISGTSTGQLVLNDRVSPGNPNDNLAVISSSGGAVPLSTGIMYVRSEDLDPSGLLKPGIPIEPLILRANAGDCIVVNLTNNINPEASPGVTSDLYKQSFFMAPPFNTSLYPTKVSRYVGLHPQLLAYDAAQSFGINVGWNSQGQKDQVVPFGKTVQYQWYAGKVGRNNVGGLTYTPIEYGSLNLLTSDPVYQNINGLFGAMVIEPAGSTWQCGEAVSLANCDPGGAPATSRASATVTLSKPLANGTKMFREFVVMISDAMISNNNNPSKPVQAQGAVNYRTEPQAFRYQYNATTDFSCMSSNLLNQGNPPPPTAFGDPKTPIFTAEVGDNVRFRMAHPFGTGASQVITVHGHVWQRNPYTAESRVIDSNNLSQWLGSRDNHGSSDHFDFVIDKAGGENRQAGDYLYTGFVPIQARQGAWGIFRVGHRAGPQAPNAVCAPVTPPTNYMVPKPKDDLERFNRPVIRPGQNPGQP